MNNKIIAWVLLINTHGNYYKHEMTTLLLQQWVVVTSTMLRTLILHVFRISKEALFFRWSSTYIYFYLYSEVAHIFIFSIQLFFYISRHSFRVFYNFFFAAIKRCPYIRLRFDAKFVTIPYNLSKTEAQTVFALHRNQLQCKSFDWFLCDWTSGRKWVSLSCVILKNG